MGRDLGKKQLELYINRATCPGFEIYVTRSAKRRGKKGRKRMNECIVLFSLLIQPDIRVAKVTSGERWKSYVFSYAVCIHVSLIKAVSFFFVCFNVSVGLIA